MSSSPAHRAEPAEEFTFPVFSGRGEERLNALAGQANEDPAPSREGVGQMTEERSPGSGQTRSPSRTSQSSGFMSGSHGIAFRVPYSGGAAPVFHRTSECPSVGTAVKDG